MGQATIKEANTTSWNQLVSKTEKPLMVMFYSQTCPFCKQMETIFEQYAAKYQKKVSFVRVDIGKNPDIASIYGVMGTPTFAFFCNGHPLQSASGALYPTILEKMIEEGLSHGKDCEKKTTWNDPMYA